MPPQLAAINRFSTTRLLTIRHWPVTPTWESTLSVIYLRRHPYFLRSSDVLLLDSVCFYSTWSSLFQPTTPGTVFHPSVCGPSCKYPRTSL
jgi:hypothetical protein